MEQTLTREILGRCSALSQEILALDRQLFRLKREMSLLEPEWLTTVDAALRSRMREKPNTATPEKCRETLETLRERLLKTQAERYREQACLCSLIESIPDSETRAVFLYRNMEGLIWEEVASRMGPGYTADACRMRHSRYLAKLPIARRQASRADSPSAAGKSGCTPNSCAQTPLGSAT